MPLSCLCRWTYACSVSTLTLPHTSRSNGGRTVPNRGSSSPLGAAHLARLTQPQGRMMVWARDQSVPPKNRRGSRGSPGRSGNRYTLETVSYALSWRCSSWCQSWATAALSSILNIPPGKPIAVSPVFGVWRLSGWWRGSCVSAWSHSINASVARQDANRQHSSWCACRPSGNVFSSWAILVVVTIMLEHTRRWLGSRRTGPSKRRRPKFTRPSWMRS